MKRICFFLLFFPLMLNAQLSRQEANGEPTRQVTVHPEGAVTITWEFPRYLSNTIVENDTEFERIIYQGFGFLNDIGKPDMPAWIDHIAVPDDGDVSVRVMDAQYYPAEKGVLLMPAQEPRQDNYLSEDPAFVMDTTFYEQDIRFPAQYANVDLSQRMRDIQVAALQIVPFSYNPARQELQALKSITVELTFTSSKNTITDPSMHSGFYTRFLGRYFLNGEVIMRQAEGHADASPSQDPDYLIVTTIDHIPAAEKLATWKMQLGFRPEIIAEHSLSAAQVKTAIHSRYASYTPKPDFFVIIGDHSTVPGEVHTTHGRTYATDHFYSVMTPISTSYTADMGRGRISATNPAQSEMIVDKIIAYEKSPPMDSSYYNTGVNAAYFQHAGGGYAERRFAQTSEDLRNYAMGRGMNVERVYYTHSYVTPTNWNNTFYSAGEPIPTELLKPGFPWDGDRHDILSHVNSGVSFVFHRDHGYTQGWGDPAFNNNDVNNMANADKLPIFFSINCLTGKFIGQESFAERLLRKNNGGAVGVFAHADISYSGYNDALSLALFDGIWSDPGLVPNFTGSGGVSNPSITPHEGIRTGGFLVIHALARMEATWSTNQYTNELFHYFGDPAMEIRVDYPQLITADPTDSILCNVDTALIIQNLNTDSVLATLVVDGIPEARKILRGTQDTLFFNPVAGGNALLTLSKSAHAPHVDTVHIYGGCPRARIEVSQSKQCVGDSITFSHSSFGNINSYSWTFDTSATIAQSNNPGPHTLTYTSGGMKKVYLTVSTPSGLLHTDSVILDIASLCDYKMPASGHIIIDKCSGRLFDDGGPFSNYSNNADGMVTIAPPGASSISLVFNSFQFEPAYDYLNIHDGSSINAPLIGSYEGATLPNGGVINSTSNSITLHQLTNQSVNESGFELEWQCAYPHTAPVANFKTTDTMSCNGQVAFRDQSLYGPSSWLWQFGDGSTSTQQNPVHQYMDNGVYTVKLLVSNSFGVDSVVKAAKVEVNMPGTPTAQDAIRCNAGSLSLQATPPPSGGGYIRWFSDATSMNVLGTGDVYVTPILGNSRSYFLEYASDEPIAYGAKYDHSGSGGFFESPFVHYLVFDVHEPGRLLTVKVYSNASKSREIQLRDHAGNVIESRIVNIPAGEHRITLNFDLQPGFNYQLAGPASPNLYRNSGSVNYPYTVDDLITIKHSSAGSNPGGYYYYFYDWEVEPPACHSHRVQVDAIVSDTLSPVSQFSINMDADPEIQFTSNSLYATSYYWDFGDGNTTAMANPTHTYAANGMYDVMLVASNSCGKDTLVKQVQVVASSIEEYAENSMEVFPNPTEGELNIQLPEGVNGVVVLQMVDQAGNHVSAQSLEAKNQKTITTRLDNLAAGTYFVLLHDGHKTYMAKVVVY